MSADATWHRRAACKGQSDVMYDETAAGVAAARAVCASCPVKRPCLVEALSLPSYLDFGVWAGTTPADRRALRRQAVLVQSDAC